MWITLLAPKPGDAVEDGRARKALPPQTLEQGAVQRRVMHLSPSPMKMRTRNCSPSRTRIGTSRLQETGRRLAHEGEAWRPRPSGSPLAFRVTMKPFATWTVLPHGKLTRLDEHVLSVTGTMHMPPMGEVERRMTVVRLADGRLVVWSAIALDEAQMQEPRALRDPGVPDRPWGPAPHGRQGLEGPLSAPGGGRRGGHPAEEVEEIVPVDATEIDFGDPKVQFVTVPGTGEREAALLVEGTGGTTLVLDRSILESGQSTGAARLALQGHRDDGRAGAHSARGPDAQGRGP